MAKKEINIFSISLLDLISGALGAVIILYIIIDKKPNDYTQGFEEELFRCDSTLTGNLESLEAKIAGLRNDIPRQEYEEIQHELEAVENNIVCFKQIIEQQNDAIKQLSEELQQANDSIIVLKDELEQLQASLQLCETEKADLQQQLSEAISESENFEKLYEKYKTMYEECEAEVNKKAIGFELTENTLFVIDVSGSMEGDKLSNVKAGIKMLIATMNQDFSVDVVFFPHRNDDDYGFKFGYLKQLTQNTKYDIYNFLEGLVADGGTPTESVMNYALRTYTDATTIVLLSDGEPDDVTTNAEANSMVRRISAKNVRNITINTIGVGKEFRTPLPSTKKRFLEYLSEQNDGFFEGF